MTGTQQNVFEQGFIEASTRDIKKHSFNEEKKHLQAYRK